MADWRDHLAEVELEKRRGAVLRHLFASAPDHALAKSILIQGVRAQGVPTTNAQLSETLSWLRQASLVTVQWIGSMEIITLTLAGRELASGYTSLDGVVFAGLAS